MGGHKAFTLVEVIVFMGVLMVITSLAVVLATPQLMRQRSENVAREIASSIFAAQQNAYSGFNYKQYGVRFTENSYSQFIGPSWDEKESFDTVVLPSGTTITKVDFTNGSVDVVFEREVLIPSVTGSLLIRSGTEEYAVTINRQGLIDYEKR